MPEFICNTSPFQYLHQVGHLGILPALAGPVIVPRAVREEIEIGRAAGYDLPDLGALPWVAIRQPASWPALPLAADLGQGEAAVLALALEAKSSVVILDDGVARRAAELLNLPLTGTLGLLVDAKKKGLIPSVSTVLDELNRLRFRVSPGTRLTVLRLAGESDAHN